MRLRYVSDNAWSAENWPASDHEEPDTKVARAKLASGLYVEAKDEAKPARGGDKE